MKERIALSIANLEIGFSGKALLPPLSANVYGGELISVIGHNGIGKSTLLRTLAGVSERISGRIIAGVCDIAEADRKELAKLIGYISTEPVDSPNMTVFDLVSTGRYPYTNWIGSLTPADRHVIQHSLEISRLGDLSGRYINELSDGERQRALIARVMAQETSILILDEPTSFLDIRNRYEMIHLLRSVTATEGRSVVMSTHDLQSAIGESDKIWLLSDKGLTEGAPEDLVLSDAFECMFGMETVRFRKSDGTFYPLRQERGEICLKCGGLKGQWTGRALKRLGFRVVNKESPGCPTVLCDDKKNEWSVTIGSSGQNFDSIYELCRHLNQIN
jgi:iron complex transport system ATP-binding protein